MKNVELYEVLRLSIDFEDRVANSNEFWNREYNGLTVKTACQGYAMNSHTCCWSVRARSRVTPCRLAESRMPLWGYQTGRNAHLRLETSKLQNWDVKFWPDILQAQARLTVCLWVLLRRKLIYYPLGSFGIDSSASPIRRRWCIHRKQCWFRLEGSLGEHFTSNKELRTPKATWGESVSFPWARH